MRITDLDIVNNNATNHSSSATAGHRLTFSVNLESVLPRAGLYNYNELLTVHAQQAISIA